MQKRLLLLRLSYTTLIAQPEMSYGIQHLQQVYQAQRPSETLQHCETEIARLVHFLQLI